MRTGFENAVHRRQTIAALVLVGFPLATLLAAACSGGSSSGGRVCAPGSTQACVGPGACAGGQSCRDGEGGQREAITWLPVEREAIVEREAEGGHNLVA
jgi:hypothetical protein